MRNRIAKLIAPLIALCIIFSIPGKPVHAEELNSQMQYPVIMVHGLFGWGNNEVNGIYYWGGSDSLKQMLSDKGYKVYTPTIGPVSSNWDRACELYAYIKGGTVDYGLAHSEKYGHARYGRTYAGIYPEFGTISESGKIQKINLIGHSMGGQTIRTFVQLLEKGSPDEVEATSADEISPLFVGKKSWVNSITTIATPHDGSQESHEQYKLEPLSNQFFAAMAIHNDNDINPEHSNLDFQLDQWGLKREENECYLSYYNRVMKSNIWEKTKDLSVWDLAPEGARDLNSWVEAQSDIYYFSTGCLDTHEAAITKFQIPNKNMNRRLWRTSIFMGSYLNDKEGDVPIDRTWWKNDGIVSLISATSPKVGSNDAEVPYDGIPKRGVWNYLGTVENVDHLDIVQMKNNRTYLLNQYFKLIQMIDSLPQTSD